MDDVHECVIGLRPVEDADLDDLFDQQRDPESVRMAAFTPEDPADRDRFIAHMTRVRARPDVTHLSITCQQDLVGSIALFVLDGQTEVTYWVARDHWGRGVASRALQDILELVPDRPVHGRAASDNVGSLRVLQKAGFRVTGTEVAYAAGRGHDIEETLLVLD